MKNVSAFFESCEKLCVPSHKVRHCHLVVVALRYCSQLWFLIVVHVHIAIQLCSAGDITELRDPVKLVACLQYILETAKQ